MKRDGRLYLSVYLQADTRAVAKKSYIKEEEKYTV